MEIGRQIREHRERLGLSQEELAGRIYVSRQTISNWETDRTYPDIHSLLLLSTLFAVTIDELVRGDVVSMKKTVDEKKMRFWSRVMAALIAIGFLSMGLFSSLWGLWGMAISVAILVVACVASFQVERIKKRNNVQTYSEILSFMNDTPRDEERITKERQRLVATRVLLAVGAAAVAACITAVSFIFFAGA